MIIEFKKNLTCGCRGIGIGEVKKWILSDFYNEKVYLFRFNKKYFICKEKPLKYERIWLYELGRFEEL